MSGWIKLEKDLLTDPRLVAASMALEARFELSEASTEVRGSSGALLMQGSNVTALPSVTMVVGGLARLWMIADTHIGEDDVLALNVAQIDKLIGIDGFCEILPKDWLEILDGNRVKLPNYHGHNGSTARERSSNADRQARYRDRHKIGNVTKRNGVTLPDLDKTKTETRPRQDQELKPQEKRGRGSHARLGRSPPRKRCPTEFEITPDLRDWAKAKAPDVDVERETERFRDWEFKHGRTDWPATWRTWMARAQETIASRPTFGRAVTLTRRPKTADELDAEYEASRAAQ